MSVVDLMPLFWGSYLESVFLCLLFGHIHYSLNCQIQKIRSYVEVLNLFGVEFYLGWETGSAFTSKSSNAVWLAPFVEDTSFSPTCIFGFFSKIRRLQWVYVNLQLFHWSMGLCCLYCYSFVVSLSFSSSWLVA